MKRTTRQEKAQETLRIIEQGFYTVDDTDISVKDEISKSINDTLLYRSDEFESVLASADEKLKGLDYETLIAVENTTVLQGAAQLQQREGKTGCLNFASAKNPGGGFLGGAMAQEESLALSSALYPTLTKHFEMYEYNRGRSTYLYSDCMIYSPDVAVFRNDDGELTNDFLTLSFVTSPAVNIGAMKNNRPEEMELAEAAMLQRMDRVLALMVHHDIDHLLLGAWGCGVFQNDPNDIAGYFAHYLMPGGKYSRAFKSVLFAVLDRSKTGDNINAFREHFSLERSLNKQE